MQMANLLAIELVVLEDVAGRRKKKSARTGGGVDDGGSGLRAHDRDDGVDQNAGREVLACAGFRILRVLVPDFVDEIGSGGRHQE